VCIPGRKRPRIRLQFVTCHDASHSNRVVRSQDPSYTISLREAILERDND
jgi:hypothetical protein